MNGTKIVLGALGVLVVASEISQRRTGAPNRRRGSRITIPQAREYGEEAGYSAATHTDFDVGEWLDENLDPDDPMDCFDDLVEALTQSAGESESHARSFSPWEHLAYAINSDEEASDELWESYDRGVSKGIERGVRERLGTMQQRRSLRGGRRALPHVLDAWMREWQAETIEAEVQR